MCTIVYGESDVLSFLGRFSRKCSILHAWLGLHCTSKGDQTRPGKCTHVKRCQGFFTTYAGAVLVHFCKYFACLECDSAGRVSSGLDCATLRCAPLWPMKRHSWESVVPSVTTFVGVACISESKFGAERDWKTLV